MTTLWKSPACTFEQGTEPVLGWGLVSPGELTHPCLPLSVIRLEGHRVWQPPEHRLQELPTRSSWNAFLASKAIPSLCPWRPV